MVKVPTLNQNVQASGPADIRKRTTATAESFGANEARLKGHLFRGVQKVGREGFNLAVRQASKMSDLEDRNLARDSVNKAMNDVRQVSSGFSRRRRGQVEGMNEEAFTSVQEIKASYLEGMDSDYQKQLFSTQFDNFSNSTLNVLKNHHDREVIAHEQETLDAQNSLLGDLVIDYRDMSETDYVTLNTDKGVVRVQGRAALIDQVEIQRALNVRQKLIGSGEAVIQQALAKDKSLLHSNVIATFAQTDPRKALRYYNQYKDRIEPEFRGRLEEALREKVNEANMITHLDGFERAGFNEEKQLSEIDEIYKDDNKQLKEAKSRVKAKFKEKEGLQKKKHQGVVNEQYNVIKQFTLADINSQGFSYNPPMALDHKNKQYLYNAYQEHMKDLFGVGRTTNYDVYYDLYRMEKSKFNQINLLNPKYRNELSSKHFEEFTKMQRKSESDWVSVRSTQSIVNDFVKGVAFEFPELQREYYETIEEELNKQRPEDRNKIETVNKIIHDLSFGLEVEGTLFEKNLFEIAREEKEEKVLLQPVSEQEAEGVPDDAKFIREYKVNYGNGRYRVMPGYLTPDGSFFTIDGTLEAKGK